MTPRLLLIGAIALLLATAGGAARADTVQLWSIYLKVRSVNSNVTLSPVGALYDADCPSGVCRFRYPAGTRVTLTAVRGPFSSFVKWEPLYTDRPGCYGSAPSCTLVMDGTKGVRATFNPLQVWLSSNPGGHVDADGGQGCGNGCVQYSYGSKVTVHARADPGSHFASWTSDVCHSVTSSGCYFYIYDNTYISAYFVGDDGTAKIGQPITQYVPFRVSFAGNGTGTVAGSGGLSCPSRCAVEYERGRQVALTATPTGGSHFSGWAGSVCANARGETCVFRSVPTPSGGGRSVTAYFNR